MSVGIKPLGTRVLIKKLEAEEKTSGGIILTSAAKEQPQMAEVLEVGPGTKDEPMELKAGDKVIFAKYAGTDVKFDGKESIKIPRKMEISPESDSLMNYIVTYFTPLLSFDMNNTTSIFMNSLLFLLIGLMYVGSNASYLNPVLGVFGFKIFGVTGFPHAHHIITNLSFDDIETARATDVELTSYRLGDGIYILKRK